MTKMITCLGCGEVKKHGAFGLCRKCYRNLPDQKKKTQEYSKKYNITHPKNTTKWNHKTGKCLPRLENKNCAPYLGYISEQIIAKIYLNVQIMPNNHVGYDFICLNNYTIDVKGSCRIKRDKHADRWNFHIHKNKIPDYFACLAFDNRDNLNIEHFWLISGNVINNKIGIGISETNLFQWNQYRQSNEIINQCNIVKGNINE